MSKDCCDKAGSIISADSRYENGKFFLRFSEGCLPELFTVRFIAPASYTVGDTIVVKGKELSVRTPSMSTAPSGMFTSGAVIQCEIDLDRELAFFWQGNSGGGESFSGRRLLTAATTYYLRKDGNDNNDGLSEGTAFETWDRMWQELMVIDGSGNTLTINLGAGTWRNTFTFDGRYCIGFETITLVGQGDKTVISPNGGNGIFVGYGSIRVYVQDVVISGADIGLYSVYWGYIGIFGTVTLSGITNMGLYANHYSVITTHTDSIVTFTKNPSCGSLLGASYNGYIALNSGTKISLTDTNAGTQCMYSRWGGRIHINANSTISGTFTGRKYTVSYAGLLYCGGKTLPGTLAGTVSKDGCVW